jgi:hypothetical protein
MKNFPVAQLRWPYVIYQLPFCLARRKMFNNSDSQWGHKAIFVAVGKENKILIIKGIVSKLTIQFWMCQKCGKMKGYN